VARRGAGESHRERAKPPDAPARRTAGATPVPARTARSDPDRGWLQPAGGGGRAFRWHRACADALPPASPRGAHAQRQSRHHVELAGAAAAAAGGGASGSGAQPAVGFGAGGFRARAGRCGLALRPRQLARSALRAAVRRMDRAGGRARADRADGRRRSARFVALAAARGAESLDALRHAALEGLGVALGRMVTSKSLIDAGRLQVLGENYLAVKEAYWLVYPPRSQEHRGLQLFREWLLAEADDYRR